MTFRDLLSWAADALSAAGMFGLLWLGLVAGAVVEDTVASFAQVPAVEGAP
ncbi:MAG: hypothetical protein ACU0CO_09960 [Shimia sp.]